MYDLYSIHVSYIKPSFIISECENRSMASGPRKTKTKHYEVPETNLYIVCYVGDIRDASTKGVVTGENSQHSNKASQVTAALSEVLGKTYINNRLKHLAHKKHEQDVFVVETGRRDSLEYVFHVCVTGFPVFAIPENWVLEMQSVYKSVWEMADRKGVESLTLPLLGAGKYLKFFVFNCCFVITVHFFLHVSPW